MRLHVVGPGALGTLFAVRLAAAGHSVTVLGRSDPSGYPARWRIEGTDPVDAPVEYLGRSDPRGPSDGVLLAVKAYDLEAAAARLGPLDPVPVLLIQNGLGIEALAERGLRAAGAVASVARTIRAVVSVPATWIAPGVVRQAGRGEVLLAGPTPGAAGSDGDRWAETLGGAGVPVRRVADLPRELWRKLLVNAAINPVTADHRVDNGRLAEDPWRGEALRLLSEARRVAESEGVVFSEEEAERDLFTVVRATAANRSSMRQDVERGRPTEIDAISGALLELGTSHGLDLPATRRVVRRLRGRPAAAASKP